MIGAGGQGRVFRPHNCDVVFKLSPVLGDDDLDRAAIEARFTLPHPGIIKANSTEVRVRTMIQPAPACHHSLRLPSTAQASA